MKLRHLYLFVSLLAVIATGVLCLAAPSPTGAPVVPFGLVAGADEAHAKAAAAEAPARLRAS